MRPDRSLRQQIAARHLGCCAALFAWPFAAQAALDWSPSLTQAYVYENNVFDDAGASEAQDLRGTTRRADGVWRQVLGLEGDYRWSRQALHLSAEGSRLQYQHFSEIDREEYALDAAYDWQLTSTWGGRIEYRDQRHAASFADLGNGSLSIQRGRRLAAQLNLKPLPDWRVDAGAERYRLALPLPEASAYRFDSSRVLLALRYLGTSDWDAGVRADLTRGEFSGVPQASHYEERTVRLTLDRQFGAGSHFNAALGWVRREEPGRAAVSGVAASLSFRHPFSSKTALELEAARGIENFSAGGNAMFETRVSAALRWRWSLKTQFSARYQWSRNEFQGSSPALVPDYGGRVDRTQHWTLRIDWSALDWLSLGAYGEYRDRQSNLARQGYNGWTFGIQLRAEPGE